MHISKVLYAFLCYLAQQAIVVQLLAIYVHLSCNLVSNGQSCCWLQTSQVFTILALCPHEPLPMSTLKQFLGTESNDPNRIQTIKDCDLLIAIPEQGKSTDKYDAVERVNFHRNAQQAFKSVFIGGGKYTLQ